MGPGIDAEMGGRANHGGEAKGRRERGGGGGRQKAGRKHKWSFAGTTQIRPKRRVEAGAAGEERARKRRIVESEKKQAADKQKNGQGQPQTPWLRGRVRAEAERRDEQAAKTR